MLSFVEILVVSSAWGQQNANMPVKLIQRYAVCQNNIRRLKAREVILHGNQKANGGDSYKVVYAS